MRCLSLHQWSIISNITNKVHWDAPGLVSICVTLVSPEMRLLGRTWKYMPWVVVAICAPVCRADGVYGGNGAGDLPDACSTTWWTHWELTPVPLEAAHLTHLSCSRISRGGCGGMTCGLLSAVCMFYEGTGMNKTASSVWIGVAGIELGTLFFNRSWTHVKRKRMYYTIETIVSHGNRNSFQNSKKKLVMF